jgi:GxxExxY protein
MNRQDAMNAKIIEPSPELDQIAHSVIGAAIEVHRILGPGYLENVYEEAPCVELTDRAIDYSRQVCFKIRYKGFVVS